MSNQGTARRLTVHVFLSTVFKYWRFIALCVGLATAATLLYMLRSPDVYRSTITVSVNPERLQSVSLLRKEQFVSNASLRELINSEMAVLTSPSIVYAAWKKARPEAVTTLGEEEMWKQSSSMASQITTSPVRNALLSNVRFHYTDPELCSDILNELVIARMEQLLRERQQGENQDFNRLLDRTEEVIDSLDTIIGQLQLDEDVFSSSQEISSLLTQRSTNATRIKELQQEQFRSSLMIDMYETSLASDLNIEDVPLPKDTSVLAELRRLCRDRARLVELQLETLLADAPEVVVAQQDLANVRAQYRSEIEIACSLLKADKTIISAEIEERFQRQSEFDARLRRYPVINHILDRLNDERSKQQSMRDILRNQRNEAQIAFLQISSSRYLELISPAVVPTSPVKPRRILSTLSALHPKHNG